MYRLMRNIHLVIGLLFVLMAVIFAISSLAVIYRPWLPMGSQENEQTVQLDVAPGAEPRTVALDLMRNHDLRGDLLNIQQRDGQVTFRVFRPGEEAQVTYDEASRQAVVKTRRWSFLQTLLQLHTNHGLHHEFLPAQLWSLISFLTSLGLIALGATGIYLWFGNHKDRVIGGALLALGLLYGLSTLTMARML